MFRFKKEYLSGDFFTLCLINLLNLNVISSFLILFIVSYFFFIYSYAQSKGQLNSYDALILGLSCLLILTVKIISLPLVISNIKKKNQNIAIANLIDKVKTNKILQKKILVTIFLIEFIINLILSITNSLVIKGSMINFLYNTLMFNLMYLFTGAGLFGSYLVLFLWWKIKVKY